MINWFKNNGWLLKGTKDTLEQSVFLALFVALAMLANFICIQLELPPNVGIITLFVAIIWFFNLTLAKQSAKIKKKIDPLEE